MGLAAARERLRRARLYLVVDAAAEHVLPAALRGGVDMVQLRDKELDDDALLAAAARFRAVCDEHDALFWLNDRPDLALRRAPTASTSGRTTSRLPQVRERVGERAADRPLDALARPIRRCARARRPTSSASGPVWETPTKAGRPAAGLGYVRHAAAHGGDRPWFAIGGIDERNVGEVVDGGRAPDRGGAGDPRGRRIPSRRRARAAPPRSAGR